MSISENKPSGLRRWIVIITVLLGAMIELIDVSIVNVALTDIRGNLGATLGDASWVSTGYAAANVVMITLSGWLSAKLGRRNQFGFSIILFTIASVFCGTSTNIWELVAFRILQGIGGGGLLSTAHAIMIQSFPKEKLGVANAIFGLGVVIGPTIGPTLGGYIIDHSSWHWIFFINLPIGIVAAILTFLFIQDETQTRKVNDMDWLGLGLLVAGIGSLQVVLEKGESEDWFETTYITVLSMLAAIGFIFFVIRMLTVQNPIVNLRIMRHRSFWVGALFNFILGFGLYASVFIIPVFAQSYLNFTATDTGLLLMPSSIATAFMMPFIGRITTKISPVILSGIGFLIFFIFSYALSSMTLEVGRDYFFWPLIIRGIGLGFIFTPLNTLAIGPLEGAEVPQGTAQLNMLRQLGGSFGTAIMTTYITTRTKVHYGELMAHVQSNTAMTDERLKAYEQVFLSNGYPPFEASKQALSMLYANVLKQSSLLTYTDAFLLVGIFFVVVTPLLLLFRKPKASIGNAADMMH